METHFPKSNFNSKWFQNLRSGFPLERGITRLDFNKLMCASKSREAGLHV
jgi:hypothetical protein